MDSDEQNPGQGVPVAWQDTATTPIKYKTYINGGQLPDKAEVLAAIKAAFDAYAAVTCTTLAFEHAGEVAAGNLLTGGEEGFILVYFGHDASTWIYGSSAYHRFLKFKTAEKGDIDIGVIAMNAKDYAWTAAGAEANKLDIQTAVTQMIPNVIGYHASADPMNGSLTEIKFNYENRTLSQAQEDGARFNYFDSAEAGCTQPAAPAICASGMPTGDGGPGGDGSVTPGGDGSVTPGGDGSVTPPKKDGGTQPMGDGGTSMYDGGGIGGDGPGGDGDDDGCCRVSHARSTSLPFVVLVGLVLGLALVRRRFR